MASTETGGRRPHWFPRAVTALAGLFLLVSGLWAMVDPEAFFDAVATFEPYNQHLLQDIGAFQIGLGAVLLVAIFAGDGLSTALLGVGLGMAAHTISHIIGRDLGGTPETDIPFFAVLTALLLVAGILRWREAGST